MKKTTPRPALASALLALPMIGGCDAGPEAPRVPPFEPAPVATGARPRGGSTPPAPAGVKLRPGEAPRE